MKRAAIALAFLIGLISHAYSQDSNMTEAAKRVGESLKAALEKDESFKGLPIATDALAAPASLSIVRAMAKGAYPGTGVYAVLLDADGTTYGKRGAKDLADLVRARGWLEKPPEADVLVRLANAALYDNLLAVDDSEPPVIAKRDGALTLRFMRRNHPSRARDTVVVRIEARGPASSKLEPE